MMTMDFETSEVILARSDGKEARLPLQMATAESSALARLHVAPAHMSLLAVTRTGDEVLFETPRFDGADQQHGRFVVYLDQNHWSTIANALHNPDKVDTAELAAALQLAEYARMRQVILPASAAHHHETTKRFDRDKRYRLALTVLQLSRGWQMRDPLQVRRNEIRQVISRRYGLPGSQSNPPVFSLAPGTIYSPLRGSFRYMPPADFPPMTAFQLQALAEATGHIDAMLDAERVEDGPDTGWVSASQRFSDWLDDQQKDSQQKRNTIDALLLSDLAKEIAEESAAAGASADQLREWIQKYWAGDVRQAPATGLFRELMHDRHLNKGTIWKRNDLTDMIYLSCAAGYADFVVCERHMSSALNRGINRLGASKQVFRRLSDVIQPIHSALQGMPR